MFAKTDVIITIFLLKGLLQFSNNLLRDYLEKKNPHKRKEISFHYHEILQLKDMALRNTRLPSSFQLHNVCPEKMMQILYTCKDHIAEYTKGLSNSLT